MATKTAKRRKTADAAAPAEPLLTEQADEFLDISTLETWLWDAALSAAPLVDKEEPQ